MSSFAEDLEAIAAAKVAYQKSIQDNFKNLLNGFFDKYPVVQKFGWDQYAPYFNDGDPCVFNVNDYSLWVERGNGRELIEDLSWRWNRELERREAIEVWATEFNEDFVNLLGAVGHDTFEEAFGNDTAITVTREGIQVEDCDPHD